MTHLSATFLLCKCVVIFSLLSCLFFGGSAVALQFHEVGPAPVSAVVAREQFRSLIEKIDVGNRQQTVATISGLLLWYRDIFDEEMIAAWKGYGRANLPELIEALADAPMASGIVEFSWLQQRGATFTPANAPLLGHLMARYPDSAKPFLDDLLAPAGKSPDLSKTEAQTVCRILLDMPDIGNWRKTALQVLPHYREVAEDLLGQDVRGSDQAKSYAAQRWLNSLKAVATGFSPQSAALATSPPVAKPGPAARDAAITSNSVPPVSQSPTQAVSGASSATLIHEYKFNGDASDSAGSENGQLVNGAAATGGILTLNGTNQYVQFASHIVPTSGSYSVALFAREPAPVSNFVEFISQGASGGPGFYIGHTPAPHAIRASDSWMATGVSYLSDAKWHSYILIVDADAAQSRLLVDEIQWATLPHAISTASNGTNTRLGRQYDPSAEYFRGNLADVRIYRGALSDDDIARFSANLPVATPPIPSATQSGPGTLGPDGAHKVGNGVSAPVVITKVVQESTDLAIKLSIEGTVLLSTIVAADGTARDINVVKSLGYGLDEKAIEALRKWRFRPGMKDGSPVAVRAQIEMNFRMIGKGALDQWYYSGPMAFAPGPGIGWPQIADVNMPKPDGIFRHESVVLEFTVDSGGSVRNVHSVHGTQSSSDLLARNLATWKFRPAMQGNVPVATVGRARFIKGQGDEASKHPLEPPSPGGNPSAPDAPSNTAGELISSVMFKGSPANPTIVIAGNGFNPRPAASGLALGGFDGNDYGPSLHIQDSTGPTAFDAGYDNPSEHKHDYIGLVVSTYEDGVISYTLGSNYQTSYYPSHAFQLNEGDSFTVFVREATFSGKVHYQSDAGALPYPFTAPATANASGIRTVANAKDGQTYVWIPPGTFTMGCSQGDTECMENEKPSHGEGISNGLWLGQTEVTQAAYRTVTGGNPSINKGDRFPVENVSWNEASNYCAAIGGRLPAETEWEYAARGHAGLTDARYGRLDDIAWYLGNSPGHAPLSVAGKQPNAFGLYDMLGNVWEWMQDSYDTTALKVVRGGAQSADSRRARASFRMGLDPQSRSNDRGFRCAADWVDPTKIAAPSTTDLSKSLAAGSHDPKVNAKDGQTYVWIPPGTFAMGCSQGDTECHDNENPAHAQRIDNGFWLGRTEVTQAAYQLVTGANPSSHKGDNLPVETVTWNDAANYCAAIGGRLPTEAEWEYAARAGTALARYGDLDAVAWHSGNSGNTSHPVSQKQPNAFGLYDMLGNVWEYADGAFPGTSARILRGGAWGVDPRNSRSSSRGSSEPSGKTGGRGFRCVGEGSGPANAAVLPKPGIGPSSSEFVAGLGTVYRGGNDVTAPRVEFKVDPEYSEQARKAKYSGAVLLSVIIDTQGRAQNILVVKSLGMGLDEKAIQAVRKWKFSPATKDGKPVNVRSQVEVNFRLL